MASDSDNIPAAGDRLTPEMLVHLGRRLADAGTAGELHQIIVEEAAAALRADMAALAVRKGRGNHLAAGPIVGGGQPMLANELLAARPVVEQVVDRRQSLRLDHPGRTLGKALDAVASLLCVPVVAGDAVEAVILLGTTGADRRFTAADQCMVEALAALAGPVLRATAEFDRFSDDLRLQIVEATRELNRALAELARVKSFNENIFESIAMGIVVFDRSFSVVFRNRMAGECFPEARNVLDALARTDIAERTPHWRDIVRDVVRMGQVCGFDQVRWASDDRGERLLTLAASPLFSGREAIVGGILTVEDVTRSVDFRRRLEASERLAAVGRLASKVAHELNNPLDGILRYLGLASRVCQTSGDARPVAYLDEARGGLMRMARIVSELLQFSRSAVQQSDDGDLRTALDNAVKSLQGRAQEKQVTVEVAIDEDVPTMASTSLCQVFTNLVKNAIEAVGPGGRVDVRALVAAGAVEVRVGDNGSGIPEDRLGHIFEPFYSTKAAGEGTGLGLAICKELVEKQGGQITAGNRPEGGAEFVVRIPTEWARGGGNAPPAEGT